MTPLHEVILNKKTDIKPIWIMRQAGRYLPEFREIRSKNPDFIKLCLDPILSTEISLQPLRRFDFDAAIIFSDILVIPEAMGLPYEMIEKKGPLIWELRRNFGLCAYSRFAGGCLGVAWWLRGVCVVLGGCWLGACLVLAGWLKGGGWVFAGWWRRRGGVGAGWSRCG